MKPASLPQTSSRREGGSPAISFTIPPTEEDIKQMQCFQGKNGYVKRPMNAFMVWSHIHRSTIKEIYPESNYYTQLGYEWTKLSKEQKQPYFDVAQKLSDIHKQQFPDYKYHSLKKASKQRVSPEQQAGLARAPAQPILPGFSMYPRQSVFLPHFWLYLPLTFNPVFPIHHSRFPNISSSVAGGNHCSNFLASPAAPSKETVQQDNNPFDSHNVHIGSVTSENHEQPAIVTSQQLSSKRDSESEEEIDVVGL